MHSLAELLLLFVCIASTAAEFILRPRDPPSLIDKLEESPGQSLILRCTSPSGQMNQKWIFKGSDMKEDHGVLIVEGADSVLTVASFDPMIHAGIYECDEGHLSASVRVESDVGPALPKGFRLCEEEENNSCVRGSCGADAFNKLSCFCPIGWSGVKCDTPHDKIRREDTNTDCLIWILIGGFLFGIILVFSIVFANYLFCPVVQRRNKETELERGTSLLERETKADEEV